MGRLIEAEALKKALEPLTCGKAKNQSYRDGLNDGLHNFFPQIIDAAPTVDAMRVVRCKDCIFWKDRQIKMADDTYRDYGPEDEQYVDITKGINVGSHCTKRGFEDMTGSWFWANANDFCSYGERKDATPSARENSPENAEKAHRDAGEEARV